MTRSQQDGHDGQEQVQCFQVSQAAPLNLQCPPDSHYSH